MSAEKSINRENFYNTEIIIYKSEREKYLGAPLGKQRPSLNCAVPTVRLRITIESIGIGMAVMPLACARVTPVPLRAVPSGPRAPGHPNPLTRALCGRK